MCKHIVVLLPNQPREFYRVTETLAKASDKINVLGYALCSEGRPGILYLLCTPHKDAYAALSKKYKFYCSEREVLIAEVENTPGQLRSILAQLANGTPPVNLPISYQAFSPGGKVLVVMEFDGPTEIARAAQLLKENGVEVLTQEPT